MSATLQDLKDRIEVTKADMPYMDAVTRDEMKNAIFWMNFFISEIEDEA